MRIFVSVAASMLLASSTVQTVKRDSFMPENDLYLEDGRVEGGITEAQFNAVIDRVESFYKPIVKGHGANLTIERKWSDSTVNAYAEQKTPTEWNVAMFGGLARRPEVTEDGFAMVVCHELGHHLAGYPYVEDWAADEGQSDMYATGACAFKVFAASRELAEAARADIPDNLKAKCDANHPEGTRDLCYRSIVAGKSLADLLGALGGTPANYDTPDTSVVTKTKHEHPKAQCRLDTYIASAMCGNTKWDYSLIPGKSLPNHNSLDAQKEAFDHSCVDGDGARPRCWFATMTTDEQQPTPTPGPDMECPLGDQTLCDMMCQIDPNFPWCNQ